ncbi:ankyrin repeat protein [Penicillium robsamsonii]|uniref:ankyrin repeat protein n=1 Tax=Penicillium robsamsonii TaxID=1792511 RepID=UPI00254895C9|nr:ankyrin repeat protein [Penicillium robsamsonii]KAJ5824744.1 ankyrin repeat protein [Penicillium robsamsonii]
MNSDGALMHIACKIDHDLCQLLIKYDALEMDIFGTQAIFVDLLDSFVYSTIGFALHFGHLEIVKLLLAKGVHLEKINIKLTTERNYEDIPLLSEFCYGNLSMKATMARSDKGLEANVMAGEPWTYDTTEVEGLEDAA